MKESSTYQAIVREGRAEEARRFVLLIGEQRVGAADEAVHKMLESITDVAELEKLGARLLRGETWQELLAARRPRRPKTKG